MIKEILEKNEKVKISNEILKSLPHWFGIPEAIDSYVEESQKMVFYACIEDGQAVGFMALNPHNPDTLEIHVMGIKEEYHRQGIGSALVNVAVNFGKINGYKLLEVKTLDESNPDLYYKRTREFYKALGFIPVECFPELWGRSNPCLLLVRPL
jgi:GNAT superfamily N-acetyltransferase